MKKLLIASLLMLPVFAMAATQTEMEVEGTKGVLATQYNYELNRTARQHTADRWFSFGKGYSNSLETRNRFWQAKDYSKYNADYEVKNTDDVLYKKIAGERESVYIPGVAHNVAMHYKNRARIAYWITNGYNGIYKKGESNRTERISGKHNKWNALRKEGQEYKNMPDQDISGNYKSLRWLSPYRSMRYNYRVGEDASSTFETVEAAE